MSAGRIETPKTGRTRTVDMSEQLSRTLRRLEIDRMVEKLRLGWQEMLPWVFCTEAGTPLDESRVRKAFAQALKRAKLPGFRLYDLRHTFASLLLAQNAPITYVSAQLGHTDATTTLRWYARWLPRADTRAVDVLDDGWVNPVDRLGEAQSGTVGSQLVANPRDASRLCYAAAESAVGVRLEGGPAVSSGVGCGGPSRIHRRHGSSSSDSRCACDVPNARTCDPRIRSPLCDLRRG